MSATAATLQDADDESDLELGIDKQPQQDDDDEDEDDDEQDESATTTSTTTSNLPIKIHISTGLHSPLLDQHLEFSASSKRTLHSIKQAISKSMVGRPPISCIQLRYRGRLLEDDDATDDGVGVGGGGMTVNDILSHHIDDDDEDEDDDISNNNEDDEDEDDSIKLSLTADILPPIDAKFGIEFRSKIVTLSTKEIIEAYCLNMAGMMYGQEEQQQSLLSTTTWNGEDNDGMGRIVSVEDEVEDGVSTTTTTVGKDASLNIRKRAAFLQKQFESMFTEETKQLIEEEHARVMKRKNIVDGGEVAASAAGGEDEEEIVYGLHSPTSSRSNAIRSARKGGRKGSKGGATMHVKKALQKNLNVVR